MSQETNDVKTYKYQFFTTRGGEKSYRRNFALFAKDSQEAEMLCDELNKKCQEMLDGRIEDLMIHLYSFGYTLDIGCGNNKRGKVGIDLKQAKGIDFIADAIYLPFKSNSFDCVILTHVLEHIPNLRKALLEAWRVSRSSVLIIVPRKKASFVHEDHVHFLDEAQYREILEDLLWIEDTFVVGISVFFICQKLFPVNDFAATRMVSVK